MHTHALCIQAAALQLHKTGLAASHEAGDDNGEGMDDGARGSGDEGSSGSSDDEEGDSDGSSESESDDDGDTVLLLVATSSLLTRPAPPEVCGSLCQA